MLTCNVPLQLSPSIVEVVYSVVGPAGTRLGQLMCSCVSRIILG